MKITLTDGTIIDVGEGFSYPLSEDVVLSAETVVKVVFASIGFAVADGARPSSNGGEPERIKVLVLEDVDSKIQVQVPVSLAGAAQLAIDLIGITPEQLASIMEDDDKPGIVQASAEDMRHLPPPSQT